MKKVVVYFIKYYFFWFLFFTLFRVFFLLVNITDTLKLSSSDIAGTFLHGTVMDFSVAGYFTMIPGVLLLLTSFLSLKWVNKIIRWYTFVVLCVVTLMGIVDAGLYQAWGCRLNAQIFPYFDNIPGMIACLNWWQALVIVLGEILIVWGCMKLQKKIFKAQIEKEGNSHKFNWPILPVMILLTGILIIPVRGGIRTSPLNFSSVYFSEKTYANHAAYNYFWSFFYALDNKHRNENPVHYMVEEEYMKILEPYEELGLETPESLISNTTGKPTNVIILFLESFSDRVVKMQSVTPNINQLKDEGVFFSSFYANGSRSDKGSTSFFASYPALLKASSILFFPEKLDSLDYFTKYFSDNGYDMSFYYGGDINFYNMRMFLGYAGFNRLVTIEDYPVSLGSKQKWGVPDEYLFARFAKELPSDKPFLSVLYNISTHEPYDIPDYHKIIAVR